MKTGPRNHFPAGPRGPARAFTLIEIMISIAILMVVILAIYSAWSAILRGARVAQDAAADSQRSRMSMRALEEALLTTEMFSQNVRYYSFVADTSGDFPALSMTARLPDSFPGSGIFGGQVLRRVSFTVEPGADRKNQLVMTQFPLLLETNNDVQPYAITLARDVTVFELKFWDVNAGDWADEFLQTNQLPKLVRVTLGMGRVGGSSSQPAEVISRIVALPGMVVTPDMQIPQVAAAGPGGIRTNGFPGRLPPPGLQPNPNFPPGVRPPPGGGPGIFPINPGLPQRDPRSGRGRG